MSSLFRLELNSNKKHFLKSNLNAHMSLLFLLIWNWNNRFAHTLRSCSSLENHTWFQTITSKVYTCFQTKTVQKPLPSGAAHNYMAYIREYPPPPDKPLFLWTVTVNSQSHIAEHGNKAVITKISSCWVYEISRLIWFCFSFVPYESSRWLYSQ